MMRKSINEAYSALFEGLTPQQKTRRALRQFLPEPPGGWDGNWQLVFDEFLRVSMNYYVYFMRCVIN